MSSAACRPSLEWRRALFCGILFLSFSSYITSGQDLAEAARQERARKTPQHKAAPHVYTDQDVKRPRILTPEDQARVEARKKRQDPAPAEQNAERLPSGPSLQTESLGEVARRNLQEKAARAAEQAEKKKFTPFSYTVPDPSLATLNPAVAPRVESAPGLNFSGRTLPTPTPSSPPHPTSRGNGAHRRISPFQPRPFAAAPPVALVAPTTPLRAPSVVRPAPVISLPSPQGAGLRRIQVQRGENWWKLAERYLGSGRRWPELRRLNPEADGPRDLLKLGSAVLVPEQQRVRGDSPQQQITVKKGDSLWSLAREYLGHGSAWTCLAQTNPQILDYTHMSIGTPLQLPTSQAPEPCRSVRIDKVQR
jgi:LysM repeat protein